ncbi:MAG TPA: hypothetical protein VG817_11615 [Gemmatimonadales bacterium]|nr:hypothetical protein [Gemmatimonadales bacterium]
MRRAAVLLSLVAFPLAAQDAPHLGTWKLNLPVGARMENGAATTIMGSGTLTIERVGDSLVGALTLDPMPDMPPRPSSRLVAPATGETEVTFTSTGTGTIKANGVEQQLVSVSTWILRANGDSLSGTVERRMQGVAMPMGGPQPLTGTRTR